LLLRHCQGRDKAFEATGRRRMVVERPAREDAMPNNAGQPPIRSGAHGDPVFRLQRALHRAYTIERLTIDGVFGSETDSFVRLFQGASGLAVDGVVGPVTWAALPTGGEMPLLQQGSHGDAVRALQQVFTDLSSEELGLYPGPVDGSFGLQTRQAAYAFQATRELTPDGIVGNQTWAAGTVLAETLELAVGLSFASA
jgi:peptidoglycan hydrolase-like protein with peptidoglycan-binding domain